MSLYPFLFQPTGEIRAVFFSTMKGYAVEFVDLFFYVCATTLKKSWSD